MNLKCIAWAGRWQEPSNDEVLKFLILNFNQIFYPKHQTDFMFKIPCKNDTLPWEIYYFRAQTQHLMLQMLPRVTSDTGWVSNDLLAGIQQPVSQRWWTLALPQLTPLWAGVLISISAELEPQTWVHSTAIFTAEQWQCWIPCSQGQQQTALSQKQNPTEKPLPHAEPLIPYMSIATF